MANQERNGRNAMPDENRPGWRPQDEHGQRRRNLSEDDERTMRDRDEDDRYMSRDRFSHWEDRSSRRYDRDDRSTDRSGPEARPIGSMTRGRYGQGQSGYGAGRYEDDRSYQPQQNQGARGERRAGNRGYDERPRERGLDDRFSQGRGGTSWNERDSYDRQFDRGYSGYGRGEYQGRDYQGRDYQGRDYQGRDYQGRDDQGRDDQGYEGRNYLGQGGQQMGYARDDDGRWGNEGYMGQRGDYGGGSQHQGWQDDARMESTYRQPSQFGPRGSQGYQGFGQPTHRGKGPAGYTRSDERIREMVCEALTDDHHVDATHIEITVRNGEVILSGTVDDRQQKRMAEHCAEQVMGVEDVQNQLRIASDKNRTGLSASEESESTNLTSPSTTNDKRGRA